MIWLSFDQYAVIESYTSQHSSNQYPQNLSFRWNINEEEFDRLVSLLAMLHELPCPGIFIGQNGFLGEVVGVKFHVNFILIAWWFLHFLLLETCKIIWKLELIQKYKRLAAWKKVDTCDLIQHSFYFCLFNLLVHLL